MNSVVLMKALNGGFAQLQKFRIAEESAEAVLEHELGCPYCGQEGSIEFEGGYTPDERTKPEFYGDQPSDYSSREMGEPHDIMDERYEELLGQYGECEHCGMEHQMLDVPSDMPMREEHMEDLDHNVDCPMCGSYETVHDHIEQEGLTGANFAQEQAHLPDDGGGRDERIGLERLSPVLAQQENEYDSDIGHKLRGRPTHGQLKTRGKLRGQGISPRDAGYGYRLDQQADRAGINRPTYDEAKDRLVQEGKY